VATTISPNIFIEWRLSLMQARNNMKLAH